MSKKNIDKLFQEKFSDFHETPDENVWKAISGSLDKKKSRRAIPIWWKLGGVAALLAVVFVVINPFEDEDNLAPVISDTENLKKENQNNAQDNIRLREEPEKTIQLVDTETLDANKQDTRNNREASVSSNTEKTSGSDVLKSNSAGTENSQLANITPQKPDRSKTAQQIVENPLVADDLTESAKNIANNDGVKPKENQFNRLEGNPPEKNLEATGVMEEGIANASKEEEEIEFSDEGQKKSIFDEIEKQIEEEEAVVEASKDKWSIGANVAPVYFSSFGEGSPIDPAFNTNSKSGELNMSYGLSIAYNVSDKLSVRTGINKVDFGYDTNEVEFSASLQGSLSSRLNNVNYSESAENVVVGSKAENSFALADRSDVITNDISRNGVMAQEFGYIEVPIELDYALVDSRFGVNLIGGVSTLFLTNNSVVLNDSDEIIELGEANNLNNLNFSTNVGFGLNYKFTPKVRLNIEPVFKYQLGTFSDISGSFNPFSVGVYSGLNFKF